eukprot:CAMPEP_0194032136 /NCGR_PEP_ID=MMETSP0009_2-20130614/5144_1 /TAXON_ID=210454 /ORGANISM="Grammatophora oceanica, Strain CCMP 410" /LENGTH=249 /DNA_ID=CAMNT_0038672487 /DNA_START=63 /DNA_END=812 /DNA_ORIENTATION=+
MDVANACYWNAVELNNEGVTNLEAGRFEEARSTFQSSLMLMKFALKQEGQRALGSVESTQGAQSQQAPEDSSATSYEWSSNPSEDTPVNGKESPIVSCTPGSTELDLSGPFIYRRALRIYYPTLTSIPSELIEESAVVLYNYALAHHLEGTPSSQDKARSYYELALTILGGQRVQLSGNHLIETAILNNMGQVCHELCDFCASQHCFGRLHNVLSTIANSCMESYFDANDWQGLLTNLMLPQPSLAAAA